MKPMVLDTQMQAETAAPRVRPIPRHVRPAASGWWLLGQKILQDRLAVVGLCILLGLLCTAILAPYLAPFPEDVTATHPAQRLRAPSWEHPLGTATLGSDIYSRLLFGGWLTLILLWFVVGVLVGIGVLHR